MTILIVSVSKVDNLDPFLETSFSLLETQTILSHYTTIMSTAWWNENRRILQTPTNWVSKCKHWVFNFEKQAFFVFTTWTDFETRFISQQKYKQTFAKQQMIKPRALVCTSAYAKLIKRNNERFFILKFGKLTQYFLHEV